MGLMTFTWDDSTPRPMLRLEGPEHKCVDWDAYTAAVRSRQVGLDEMRALVNPTYEDA